MIDISLAGLLGAFVGTLVAAAVYGTLIDAVERWVKANRSSEGDTAEEAALLRRGVLAFDIFVFAGLGYWIGYELADRF